MMTRLEKVQPFLVLVSVIVGIGLAQLPGLTDGAARLIVPLLVLMLYATFLPLSSTRFSQIGRQSKVVLASLGINFIWTPCFAWGLGVLLLQPYPDLRIGLLMLMVTPCTDWYLVFTGIARGDVVLGTALLPFNLLLQMVLLPLYLLVFAGTLVDLNPISLLQDVLWVLLLPLVLALVSRHVLRWQWGNDKLKPLSVHCSRLQTVSLNLAVIAIFTFQGEALLRYPSLFLRLLIPVLLFFVVNFLVVYQLGWWLRCSYGEFACLSCTTLARNSPLALAVAAVAFPDRPFITLALIIGPLIELPILVLVSQGLLRLRHQPQWRK